MQQPQETLAGTMSCSKDATLPFLPQEILVRIFSKLPAKSLVRFRCVSKFFCSLMVDHPFADLHRNWSLTLPSRMSIIIFFPMYANSKTHSYYTINYPQEKENQGTLQPNRLQYMDEGDLFRKVYLRSAVNGLLCFCRYPRSRDDAISIHNLSTRHHISLPRTRTLHPNSNKRMNVCGLLGFDSVSRRYKVLKSIQFTDHNYNHLYVKHWVFTLGVDQSWREIDCLLPFPFHPCHTKIRNWYNHFYFRSAVHIDGVIYSLNSLNNSDYSRFHIVAFDLASENFRVIPSPPRDDPPPYQKAGLMEVEGRLAIVDSREIGKCYAMGIWILEDEECGVWKRHIIPIPIPLEECQCENFTVRCLLFFAQNHVGEIAVLVMLVKSHSAAILFYNFRRQSWRTFDISEFFKPLRQGVMWSIAMHFILDNVF